jgi:HAD superfamily hydrolase (TIGR01509 family)
MKVTGFLAWDLDGVLFDSDMLHYLAVNEALKPYGERIGEEEHLTTFKGLPTLRKCAMLTAMGRLPASAHADVSARKQAATLDAIALAVQPDPKVSALLRALRAAGWRQCCCSNSVRKTVQQVLFQTELIEYMDFLLSNEDVRLAKPHPDIYLKAAHLFGIETGELVVVEDAEAGRRAALSAECSLVAVEGPHEVGPSLLPRILLLGRNRTEAQIA